MELLKKYPKLFQWLFLLIVFFFLCFAIDVPETYKFIRGQAEFIKDPNQSTYTLFGAEVRYYAFDVFWRLPPLLGWLPIWINDSLFFLMNEWMPMEFWNENTQSYKTRPLVLQLTRNMTAFMTFLIELIREIMLGGSSNSRSIYQLGLDRCKSMGKVTRITLDNYCSRCCDTWI